MYGLILITASPDVYANEPTAALNIKTHYESLDIAQSKKIHYLKFSLPAVIINVDDALQENLKHTENNN